MTDATPPMKGVIVGLLAVAIVASLVRARRQDLQARAGLDAAAAES